MKKLVLILVLIALVCQPLTAYAATMAGTVTEWRSGKEYAAVGVTIIVGKGINLNSGSSGNDVITNSSGIVAKAVTDGAGKFSMSIPAGSYTVIGWKAGYIPQVYYDVEPALYLPVSCSPDNQPGSGGRHQSLSYR